MNITEKIDIRRNLIGLTILSIATLFNYFLNNDIVALAATLIACLYCASCQRNLLLPSMLFLNSFAYLFRFNQYSIYVFICIVFIARVGLAEKRRLTNIAIFGVPYLLLHLFSTNVLKMAFSDYIPFILIFTLYFAASEYNAEEREVTLTYFVYGHVLSTYLGFFKSLTRLDGILGQDYVTAVQWADTTRFAGLSFDPNFYTLMAIVVLCALVFVLRNKMSISLWLVCFLSTLVGGAITFSKSFYLCVMVLLAFLVIKNLSTFGMKELRIAIFAIFLCLIFKNKIFEVFNIFLKRFSENDSLDGLTTGRWSTWGNYIKQITESMFSILVGHGVLSTGVKAAHNLFLELLYKYGALGTIMDFLYLTLCKAEMKVKMKKGPMFIVVIALFISLLFNLSAYSFAGFWACIFVIYIITSESVGCERNI